MKKSFIKRCAHLLLAPFLLIAGCVGSRPQFVMTALVTDIHTQIEVEIMNDQYNGGVMWVNFSDETKIVNGKGEKLSIDDIKKGDEIEIVYSGQVMMSYPGQIYAQKITVL